MTLVKKVIGGLASIDVTRRRGILHREGPYGDLDRRSVWDEGFCVQGDT